MNNYKHITQALKTLFFILLMTFPHLTLGQENPWETVPKGENPWASYYNQKEESPTQSTEHETKAISQSTQSIRVFKVNGSMLELNRKNYDYYKTLRNIGKKLHTANGAFAAGIISSSVFNLLVIPVNLIASAFPSSNANYKIDQFIKDNPHATHREIKAVRHGISGKRFSKALKGSVIGCAINIAVFIIVLI